MFTTMFTTRTAPRATTYTASMFTSSPRGVFAALSDNFGGAFCHLGDFRFIPSSTYKIMGNSADQAAKIGALDHTAVPACPGKGCVITVKVCDVHDGDTITVATLLGETPVKTHIRILGIDTPEIRTKNVKEKRAATVSKKYLQELI